MSAGYGYYRIEFYTNDGLPDEKKAKEAFDFCAKEFKWFTDGEPFILEDNVILGNYDKWADGLVLDMGIPYDTATIKEWMMAIFNAGITCFAGEFIEDKSEDSWEDNWVITCSVPNKAPQYLFKMQYNKNVYGLVLNTDSRDKYYYALDKETFSTYNMKFRNKVTGEEKTWFYIEIVPQPDSGIDSVFDACCEGKYCCRWRTMYKDLVLYLMDKDNNYVMPDFDYGLGAFDHFDNTDLSPIDILVKNRIFKKAESKDWEFVGLIPSSEDVFTKTKKKLAKK